MKKLMKVILGMLVAVICSLTMAIPAFAAEALEVSVPVTISLIGTLPDTAEEFTVELKANGSACPMPEGSVNDVYTMTITGADMKNIPAITYSSVGVYNYTIYQVPGSNETCAYDDTVYSLTVYITNAEDGSGLESTAVLYPDADGEKFPGVEFVNEYEVVTPSASPQPTPPSDLPKTGDKFAPLLYVVLSVVSLGMVISLLLINKKKGQKNK